MFISSQQYIALSVALLALSLTAIPSTSIAKGGWGTQPLAKKFRPARSWINQFSQTPDIIAKESIADAIASCDRVVGVGKYCVVEVSHTANDLPLEIYRSKTKLIGSNTSQPLTSSENGIYIYIGSDTKKVILENLNLQGHVAGNDEIYGIVIEGKNIRQILIRNNKIHDFDSDSDAHGIAVYGTGKNGKESIRHIIIEGNEVYSMRTGSSESIVINGNVVRWEIKNNDVYDVNNIAIDAIGGEGTSSTRKNKQGRTLPGRFDAARYGFIEDNFIENMSTLGNPAYGNEESWAAAIYIDGAHHIRIANNTVENSSWAYEIGAENCSVTRNISMMGNSAVESTYGDLLIGGYAEKGYGRDKSINCDPKTSQDKDEGHGYVKYITIKNNSLTSSNTSEERVTLQLRTTHAIIAEPSVTPVNTTRNGYAKGDGNAVKTTE
jgi:hypothetical protein